MRLKKLLHGVRYLGVCPNIYVNELRTNSKECKLGDVFVAIKGDEDGHSYIAEAIRNGASVIIHSSEVEMDSAIYLRVDDTRIALAIMAHNRFHNITKRVTLIGITGTNGKTTISTLIYHFLSYMGKMSLLIGTTGIYFKDEYYESANTTPDILISLNIIYEAYKKGARYVIMEVSSQAIDMLRIYGFDFNIAIFSNLGHDHLDYHKTHDRYMLTKGHFISSISKRRRNIVILNRDDDAFLLFYRLARANVLTYGIAKPSDFKAVNIIKSIEKGTSFKLSYKYNKIDFKTSLIGEFNVYNILAVCTCLYHLGYKMEDFSSFLKIYVSNNGRMEMLKIDKLCFFIDYAHTPDGVLNALRSIKEYKDSRLICVLGCGGNRDRSKRPLIGEIATTNSSYVIFTNDNPRCENEYDIIADIISGVKKDNFEVIINRYDAIAAAIAYARDGDIIAILGKGNEMYQIINNIKYPFNDKEVIKKILGR